MIAESARWGDATGGLFTPDNQWEAVNTNMINNYFPQRTSVVLAQLRTRGLYPQTDAPSFNQHGGPIPSGFGLTITGPAGATIYYTLDGSDPRLTGGAVSPSALAYTGSFQLTAHTTVKVRALEGGDWSRLAEGRSDRQSCIPFHRDSIRHACPSVARRGAGVEACQGTVLSVYSAGFLGH